MLELIFFFFLCLQVIESLVSTYFDCDLGEKETKHIASPLADLGKNKYIFGIPIHE